MAALPNIVPLPAPPRPDLLEDMVAPVHPMHQELLRRVSGMPEDPAFDRMERLNGPARMATIFYLGLGAWAAILLPAYLILRPA